MNKWYRILKIGQGTVRTDAVIESKQCGYVAQWKPAKSNPLNIRDSMWHTYAGKPGTWDEAWAVLEKRANPADLAVNFVGTF